MFRGKNRGQSRDNQGNKRGNFGGSFRGRGGNFRGKITKRYRDNPKRNNELAQVAMAAVQAALAAQEEQNKYKGKDTSFYNNSNEISFLADSGATEHIVNKSLFLSNFKKCTDGVTKSANKNKSADIEIGGIGDLYLKSKENKIKLTNVLSAENISENLISLRRFPDIGLRTYLDNEKLEIFDKITKENYLSGVYEKPNWRVNFTVKNDDNESSKYTAYTCNAEILSESDFTEQSQTVSKGLNDKETEGEKENNSGILIQSEIGRKKRRVKSEKTKRKQNLIQIHER